MCVCSITTCRHMVHTLTKAYTLECVELRTCLKYNHKIPNIFVSQHFYLSFVRYFFILANFSVCEGEVKAESVSRGPS